MILNVAIAVGASSIAAAYDWRAGRVPNALTYSAIGCGAVLAAISGPESALWGCAIGIGIGLLLFVVGGLGGGDVKLIVAIGTLLGPKHVIEIVSIAVPIAAVVAIVIVFRAGLFRSLVAHILLSITNVLLPGMAYVNVAPSLRLRFAPVLAVSSALVTLVPAAQFLSKS